MRQHLHVPPPQESQGSVAFSQCSKTSDVFMGVSFAPAIMSHLASDDPLDRLSTKNLNACCVVIEEVSHFHLLVNRALRTQQVSQLELEWQGEVDKLLVCAQLLHDQCGNAHMLPLARMIYDSGIIFADENDGTNEDALRYWEATRFAARFWFGAISTSPNASGILHDPDLRRLLNRAYSASWNGKLEAIAQPALRKAS